MSGIYGLFTKGQQADTEIDKLALWNQPYGSEGKHIKVENGIYLGCRQEKLSLRAGKTVPVLQSGHIYAVIDAIIYNTSELRDEVKINSDLADEELLFLLIQRQGIKALRDVNGDFAGAIYDGETGKLTLFRDHMGIRPLFYYAGNACCTFSTDIRGMIALSQVDVSVNEEWLYKVVSGYSTLHPNATEFAHIHCVNPGGFAVFSLKDSRIKLLEEGHYWLPGEKKIRLPHKEDYSKRLRELITDAIKIRLDACDGLVGAELSGGLDSGVIDILIHRLGRECVYFSWSVDPRELPLAKEDERKVIDDICQQENITCHFEHMKMSLGLDSIMADTMQKMGISMDEEENMVFRYVMPPYCNTQFISDAAQFVNRHGAKVVFTGHGGDEGVSHRCNPYEMFYHHEYYHYLRHMWSTTHGQKYRIVKTLRNCRENMKQYQEHFKGAFQNPFSAPQFIQANFWDKYKYREMPSLSFAYDATAYVRQGGSRNRLDNVALQGAYSGARYLVPYLDYRVIDYALSIPRHLYMKGNMNRYIFREAFKDIMPKSLYRLRIKRDGSYDSMPDNSQNWFAGFAKSRREIVQAMDREYWSKYLDFDKLDAWVLEGKPADEDRDREESKLYGLLPCAMLSNMLKKTRA